MTRALRVVAGRFHHWWNPVHSHIVGGLSQVTQSPGRAFRAEQGSHGSRDRGNARRLGGSGGYGRSLSSTTIVTRSFICTARMSLLGSVSRK